MPRFRYEALDAAGRPARGVMDADSEAAVILALRRQGCLPMHTEPARGDGWLRGLLRWDIGAGSGLRRQETAELIAELSVMLGAGQDVDSALRYLAETGSSARVRTVAAALRDAVRNGSALADAMARQSASFPPMQVALVRAGEAGGQLARALDHLARLLERQRTLVATVRTAMVYPSLLFAASVGAIVLMLTHVLPQFVPLFQQSGARLPASTRWLIDAGDFLAAYGLVLGFALLLAGAGIGLLLRRPLIRLSADRLLLRLPGVGAIAREVQAARLTRTLGTLLGNGVPLVGALAIVREAMSNLAARAAVEDASLSARTGHGVADSLRRSGVFPPRTTHLLALGEEHAQLGAMALRAADIHEARIAQSIQRLLALLVPVITIVMGAAVAGIVSTLLMAMLSLNDIAS